MQNTFESKGKKFTIEKATDADFYELKDFTDFWLAGRGKAKGIPGAVNDCFISPSQHAKYLRKYQVYIVRYYIEIIAWAVVQHNGSLIHLLVSGFYRKQGIGSSLLKFIAPFKIHSKKDQSTGNPETFYKKLGYKKTTTVKSKSRLDIDKIRPDRKPNIDIFEKIA